MQAQEIVRGWVKTNGRKFGWLAVQVPVAPNTMSTWMTGRGTPSAVCRARLSDIIGTDVRDVSMWKQS